MRLNNKTIRNYLFYSFVIFLLTIPLFYFGIRSLLLRAVDRSLISQLHEIRSNLGAIHSPDELAVWSKLDNDISLIRTDEITNDRVYTVNHFSPRHHEEEPYREIAGAISVDGRQYQLVIRSSLIENEDLLGSILLVQAVGLLLLIGGMLWINHLASRRLWQPFYITLKNMQDFELNKRTSLSFKDSTTDEFNDLNRAVKNLFHRSSASFDQQKEFTENAAHEMQTPLAIVQSKLELLMQTSPLSEEQADLIHSLDLTNRRLAKLNKSLLLLTKIDNNQYQTVEEIEVGALCQKLVKQYRIHAESRNLFIHGNFDLPVRIPVNPTLIEVLIGNLLSNAIRYNRDNGEVAILTSKDCLVVENTGIFSSLHPEKIFDRFHKEEGNTGAEEGTGLGLAIVRNICKLYGYTVTYRFSDGWHLFQVDFGRGPAGREPQTATEYRQNRGLPWGPNYDRQ